MTSVFASSEGPCGVFGATGPCGVGAVYAVSHARAAHLLEQRAPTQDARGDLLTSWVGIGITSLEMQPMDRDVKREIHGQVIEVAWVGFVMGGTTLQELDRTIFMGYQLEVVQVAPWGDHEEIVYKEIGR